MKKVSLAAWSLLCALLPISLGSIVWARGNISEVESLYSLGFYPKWAGFLAGFTSRIPFSIAEGLLITAGVAVIAYVVCLICRLAKGGEKRLKILGCYLLRAVGACSLVLFLFVLGGGLNYYRVSFTHYSGLEIRDTQILQLRDLCQELAADANALREGLQEDENGVFTFVDPSPQALALQARSQVQSLIEQNPQWEQLLALGADTVPKGVFFSEAMSYMQITGFYFPFTMEANVNVHTSSIVIPFSMCHELSHISGFMREDEANYLAYLACMAGNSREFQYSGTVEALIHATNALYGKNQELHREVMNTLSDGVRRDLAADSAYYYAHKTSFGNFSESVNDAYLRINDQSDGVASYGRMVDLLLARYRQIHDLP